VILVDANLVLYAEDALSPHHEAARTWWDAQAVGYLPRVPVLGCVVCVHPHQHQFPRLRATTRSRSSDEPRAELARSTVRTVGPSHRAPLEVLQALLKEGQALGNLVTDAHLAALAVQHGCTLMSTDGDFARFPKLKWSNPLK